MTRFAPILDWSRDYDRRWLRGDVLAGIAVAAMIVPKNLGYAGIAGIPVENGLYAAAAAAIIYGIFCTSRHISTGPSSSLAAVAGGAVLVTGLAGDEAAQLVAAIAIVTGVLFLLVAALKLGWLASFLSRAVVTGFLAGAAIDVVIGELPKLTGTTADGVNAWQEFASWVRGLGSLSPTTLVVGLIALAVILALRFRFPKVPGALVLVIGGLVSSVIFDLGARGVALVDPVPRGLPIPRIPSFELVSQELPTVVIASFALLLIGFSQTAGDAQAFATRHRYRIDLNQESVAQGMANIGAGVFRGMPVSTSLSASSLNESAGARSPVASLATGAIVVATLILFAPVFSELPKAVLAAIIIDAVVFGMIDLPAFRRLRRVKPFDFWIALAAVIGVLSVGVLLGVVVGVVLSLLWLIHVATRPSMPALGRQPGTHVYRDLDEHPEDDTDPGVAVIRMDGGLFFATAAALDERVRAILAQQPELHSVVLDLEGVNFVDSQGAEKLGELLDLTEATDVELRLARLKPNVSSVLAADGLIDRIGPARIHGNVHRAVKAAQAADADRVARLARPEGFEPPTY
ncbi:MAG TPA: sulfate permease [Candidatus Saccharimonadales bacterium]|nr:sulfate permease [Candidatus Saccharimonadales bacterium]